MTATLLPLLVLGAALPARLEVRVTAAAPGGGADLEDAGLSGALAQALIDAGLPATRAHDSGAPCHEGCLSVRVQRTAARRFVVEVRAPGDSARAQLQLAAGASSFDLAHALAIEVEVLSARTHARRRRPPRAAPVMAAAGETHTAPVIADDAPVPAAAPASPEAARTSGPAPVRFAGDDDATLPHSPIDDAPAVQAAPPPRAPTVDDARLGLDVAALVLAAPPGDHHLLMYGSTVGARLRLGQNGDVRAGIAFLHPERQSRAGIRYQRELQPMELVVASSLPRLRALRVGVGAQATLASGEESGRERPSSWAFGPIGRLEYRHAIRSFALLAALQIAMHPPRWHTGPRDPLPLAGVPPLTMSAGLGLEFTIF
ncbi:MAG TPA: hypothetical protein VFH68_11185 [Polyangia bacterium]|nr:hypothetical protein [Polyangia bacterium]